MNSDFEYYSDSDYESDNDSENNELIEFENELLEDEYQYQQLCSLFEIINNFRRYNNPLILDNLNNLNLLNFINIIDHN